MGGVGVAFAVRAIAQENAALSLAAVACLALALFADPIERLIKKQVTDSKDPLAGSLCVLLFVAALAFLGLAIWLFYHVLGVLRDFDISSPSTSFDTRTVTALSDALLAVIMIELAETVRQQLKRIKDDKQTLTMSLLKDLLIIGVVAGVRHLLAVSAQLTFTPSRAGDAAHSLVRLANRRSLMLELGLTAIIVLVLTALALVTHLYVRNNSSEPEAGGPAPEVPRPP